ncbi:NADH dehydrogenase subunit N [Magnetococcus marinus MC-1]|uniref:NADH-quinone oxidoreductase subunit N n=1 Tax=Magnetococcus marinus (strain ATCC BAA-1437 / JCM 17883 / MC-1) TaxID=156889 RepID=NUON_MAGMM|nr:NADH-quinone oxidoreductase subunit NuoN [Magnetococcus marinus]A0LDR4.1 RecName: Full=NADH-quinone oxidoreductase subunit N; AltName: Full=NADH dehydrogenase I subunit N; AltName: Full=NDH-1 subunit N [Magnetococcus marinus MC-1]ABK46107.1 NADH dehydrogenase subunit N [Magnetococcus marinus MC-1]
MAIQMPDINLALMLPEIVISVVAMGLLLASAWWEGAEGARRIRRIAAGALMVAMVITLLGVGATQSSTFGGMFVNDRFAAFMKVMLYLSTLLPMVVSWVYLEKSKLGNGEYFVLTLFAMLGGMFMISSGSFLVLYLGIELLSLAIYVLAAYKRDDLASNEAGLKYFVLGSMASGILLYGISLIYGVTGSVDFATINAYLQQDHHSMLGITMGLILVVSGLSFKIAAAPFHMWAPDVYEGAPTSVTAFMAAMPKIAAFAALFRVLVEAFGPMHATWGPIMALLAVVSMGVGALAGLGQSNIKRLLAYSSIGHVGYALIGLAVGNQMGYEAVLVYLTIYIFMNVGAFGLILVLNKEGFGDQIEDYKGLSAKRPGLALLMAIFMFSMAGIPPLAGFMAKLQIFMAAIDAHMYTVAILGVLFSAVSAFYYLKVIKTMYFDEAERAFDMPMDFLSRAIVGVSGILVVLWGILPGSLMASVAETIKSLM